ncbi:MAG: hypothetical protein IJX05_05070 [Clostridia bacterium]|nr:hypothetical protein [Clostridia bacterium]
MGIKALLKKNKMIVSLYEKYKERRLSKQRKKRISGKRFFVNRQKSLDKLCIILAGYKEFLYSSVFGRIIKYLPDDIDVCVITSGKRSDIVEKICEEQNWSYLSTKRNNVSLAQNIAISLHPNAEYIYKLDEDIFITENYFENMMRAYKHATGGDYAPGVIAPILPINGYGHMRILEKLNLIELYAEKFEKPKYLAGPSRQIENNSEVADFFWNGEYVPNIDELNKRFASEPISERPCAIRFSIGAIMFERSLWDEMNYFIVGKGNAMGLDEEYLCQYCMINSRPIMVSENIVVGHLSFGLQNNYMRDYYLKNEDKFR